MADPGAPRRGAGLGVALALGAVAVVIALGVAAWVLEPRLRQMLGAMPAATPAVAETAIPVAPPEARPAEAAAAPRTLAPSSSLAGLGGGMALPPAAAPPPVPRFTQAPPPVPAPAAARAPEPASAPPATRVMNVARETISRLFVARMGEGVGREDWLGNAQITPGNAVQIRAPDGQGCVFNIRAVYVGGRTEDRPGVDLCAAPELRFEGGKGAGAASSR